MNFLSFRNWLVEKFVEDSDPISDLGIGIFAVHNYKNINEIIQSFIKFLPFILHTNKIPDDIIDDTITIVNRKYLPLFNDYIEQYIRLRNKHISYNIRYTIYKRVMDEFIARGYKCPRYNN